MIDHCVSAFLEAKKWEIYRIYVTDGLRVLGRLDQRYFDYFKPPETRTSEEIITGIKDKLTRLGGGNDESVFADGDTGA